MLLCQFAAVILLAGCASVGTPPQRAERAANLREDLIRLGPAVDAGEASRLAEAAIEHSAELAARHRPVNPAWLNNMLINAGWRDWGFCYHWANDLFAHLQQFGFRTLDLRLAIAYGDTRREHNSVVVTAHGQPFAEGLVLDGWRYCGRLWWVRVANDRRHPWQPLPPAYVPPELAPQPNQ